jgi:hypothetical protein
MRLAILLFAVLPLAAAAETPMTAAEFDAFATGKTLDYYAADQVFGRETYLPGRLVLWSPVGEDCKSGSWYEDAGNICFLYDGDPEPKCWTIWADGDGLTASYSTDGPDDLPRKVLVTEEPLACMGPDVGV